MNNTDEQTVTLGLLPHETIREQAIQHLDQQQHTHCKDCGRKLKDPDSRRIGIGPECRTKRAAGMMR